MERKRRREGGFTLFEIGLTILVLAVLAMVAFPTAQYVNRRAKEMELRRSLRDMRKAIDEYHRYAMQGLIMQTDVSQDFYPPDLETLVEGVRLAGDASERKERFLRRIPNDTMTNSFEWGMRSTRDDSDSDMWGGENVFDVYSTSTAPALDGITYYNEW